MCRCLLQTTCPSRSDNDFYWTTAFGAPVSCAKPVNSTAACLECAGLRSTYSIATTTPTRNLTFSGFEIAKCYCKRTLAQLIFDHGLISGAQAMLNGKDKDLCTTVATQYVNFHAVALFASCVVVIVNVSLRYVLQWMAAYEGHHSISALHEAVAFKVRAAEYA